MKEKSNISVIIPVHQLDETTSKLLNNAVVSIKKQTLKPEEVLFVIPVNTPAIESTIKDIVKDVTSDDFNVKIVRNESLVIKGVSKIQDYEMTDMNINVTPDSFE